MRRGNSYVVRKRVLENLGQIKKKTRGPEKGNNQDIKRE